MTIVLEVWVNGERVASAGEESLGVLSAYVSAAGRLGPETLPRRGRESPPDIDLRVSGLTGRSYPRKDEHMRWGPRLSLKPGDEVTIRILDGDVFDAPSERYLKEDFPRSPLAARKRWMDARALYFRFKDKFGPRAERDAAKFMRRFWNKR